MARILNQFDSRCMRLALDLAASAAAAGEVPVGCVVARGEEVLYSDRNRSSKNVLHHAEMLALRGAADVCQSRLDGTTVYVTLEPCLMCWGALLHHRVGTVVYAAQSPKFGALSVGKILEQPFNHRPVVLSGLFSDEAAQLMQQFFRGKR